MIMSLGDRRNIRECLRRFRNFQIMRPPGETPAVDREDCFKQPSEREMLCFHSLKT